MRFFLLPATVLHFSLIATAQAPPPIPPSNSTPTIKVDVTLVPVHVVVRDSKGHAVGNLTKDDFQIFDRGKPQVIQQLSVEHAAQTFSVADPAASPARFTAYLFDDLHLQHEDLVRAREAADRQIAQISSPRDRAALFTTSGRSFVDFRSGSAKVREALAQLEPQGQRLASDCPSLSYFMADQIVEKNDREAARIASDDALSCAFGEDRRSRGEARSLALAAARERVELGRAETANCLSMLKAIVGAMSTAPGRRLVIVISPGFFIPESLQKEQNEIAELAARSDFTISALDPRGLLPSVDLDSRKQIYLTAAEAEDAAVLEALTDATAGTFFHNNNNVHDGFARILATPEYSYTLAFSPQNLKFDGHFHPIDVKLAKGEELHVAARQGYYAPRKK